MRRIKKNLQKLKRGVTRVLTMPVRQLPEGTLKTKVRLLLLNHQSSLPTELAVNRGETVVQVGTPWPSTMKRFAKAVGAEGKVVIVEAMPENFERLENALRKSNLDNVKLVQGAACNENGSGELKVSPYSGDHKLPLKDIRMDNDLRPGNEIMQSVQVRLLRLEDELEKLSIESIDYMSITINGAEVEALKGAKGLLQNSSIGTRIYAKGHALNEDGEPIHIEAKALLESIGFKVKISKGEISSTSDKSWLNRAGDVYAWK